VVVTKLSRFFLGGKGVPFPFKALVMNTNSDVYQEFP